MIKINEVCVSIEENENPENLQGVIANFLNIKIESVLNYKILKRALDARKKQNIHYKYNLAVEIEEKQLKKLMNKYHFSEYIEEQKIINKVNKNKAVAIIGSGPAGLFSALTLAKSGIEVFVLERGDNVENRVKIVNELLNNGKFNNKTNIQFGEGGAGTFSDGKLNTGIKSELIKEVLNEFCLAGANENILYDAKPHIGTDVLRKVIKNLREKIISLGGKFLFNSQFVDFEKINNKIQVSYINENVYKKLLVDDLVLATGYSARDTIRMLFEKGIQFKQKAFSVGYRIEHKQENVNISQYGENYNKKLPPADYKLFTHLKNGRTVYTFCMCPGGEVVPAMSEEGQIVTNGMSYNARSGLNANSAVLVSVGPEDYESDHPLAGIKFQEKLESSAFEKGCGKFIVSIVDDFLKNKSTTKLNDVIPTIKPCYVLGDVSKLLPEELSESIKEGIIEFGKKMPAFKDKSAVLTGIETRSSAPFMIVRDDDFQTNIRNIYAVGEGAGMAGGIVSSAVDGMKIADKIIQKYIGN